MCNQNLYLVERDSTQPVGYDKFVSMVVAAATADAARYMHPAFEPDKFIIELNRDDCRWEGTKFLEKEIDYLSPADINRTLNNEWVQSPELLKVTIVGCTWDETPKVIHYAYRDG